MSLECYDQGLLRYLQDHLNFTNIVNAEDEKALSYSVDMISDAKDLKIKLPMISFWRMSNNLTNESAGNFFAKHSGRLMSKDTSKLKGYGVRELDVNIVYQITIWASTRKVCDDIFRELAMLLITDDPHVPVYIPGMESPEYFDIIVTDSDTSVDLSNFEDQGRLYRQNLTVEMPDARLVFSKESKLIANIPLKLYTFTKPDLSDISLVRELRIPKDNAEVQRSE